MSPVIMIDDTNPGIQYSGPWFEVENTQINTGAFGPPFQNTLHGVTVNANLSFPFTGSAVLVYGTSITTNISGTQDPTWECFIDNTSIGGSPAPATSDNNWILCGGGPSQFQDGPHLLTVKTNVSNQQTFWFDQIQYAPSANVSLNQTFLRIDSSDSAIQYSSGWETLFQFINTSYTQITAATLTYQFSGTSISWVGTTEPLSNGSTIVNSTAPATYTIDDQDPINFLVPVSSNSLSYYNQILFDTGQLPFGQHKLVVTYFGNSTSVPLALNYFVQQDSDAPTSPSNNSSTSTSVPPGSSISTTTEAIIGGAIGGVVFISLLLALFFFNRRRNNRRSQALKGGSHTSPDVVNPFTVSSSNTTSNFLPQNYTSNGQSFPSQYISSKFTQMGQQPSDPAASMSGGSGTLNGQSLPSQYISRKFTRIVQQPSDPASMSSAGGILPFPLLGPQFSLPAFTSTPSSRLPPTGPQTNFNGTRRTEVPLAAAESEPLMHHRSPSPGEANARIVMHEDSGVRIPAAEDDVEELPPNYTPG